MSNYSAFDITIWEQIRSAVEVKTDTLVGEINREISRDRSLRDYQTMYPVPWQLKQVMLQRADGWIQRLYKLCCEAYKAGGEDLSADFDRAIWAYCIEPFIMGERDSTSSGYKVSMLLELLFCAAGLPPQKRNQLKVGQKDCCLNVRNEMLFSWQQKLLRLAQRLDRPTSFARFGARQVCSTRTAIDAPSEPSRSHVTLSSTPEPMPPQMPAISAPAVLAEPTGSTDQQKKVAASEPPLPAPRYPGATKWQDIEVVFLSDFAVQMRINAKLIQPTNYAELGFADGRSEKPNKAWLVLRVLAENRGVLKNGSSVGEPWSKVEKRIQEIRKQLRELFGISTDPLPFAEGAGYLAVFKIRCGSSFHS